MNKLLFTLILDRSKPQNNQGFSLFEVTIAILVSSAFLMGTLQAMTINAVMQVKAERQAQATFVIQEDIERLQATASAMDIDYIQTSATLNPTNRTRTGICYPLYFNESQEMDRRFGSYLVTELDSLLASDTYSDGVTSDTTTQSYPAINSNTVFSSAPNSTELGQRAIVQIVRNGSDDDAHPNSENNLLNKNYRLVRIMTVDRETSFNVVQVYYRVGEPYDPTDPNQTDNNGDTLRDNESGRTSIISENYTEVIPAAVAECGFSP
ncbi:MAG: hypothetical protein QNJ37_24830 [Crocosphaera sp.]|nr:hypothetical protein [Crocosphaera sp.]